MRAGESVVPEWKVHAVLAPNQTWIDDTGRTWHAAKELASGGEGVIYTIADAADKLAKIYRNPEGIQVDKLRHMLELRTDSLAKNTSWPQALLRLPTSKTVVGFLMPMLPGEPIQRVFNPQQREKTFPKKDWSFLVHVARNVAAAFDEVHKLGCVVGDVNQSNVLVSEDYLVRLIDCDSFQIPNEKGGYYHCRVGVDLFTPPELQGCSFPETVRTTNHDRFGLAVLLFQLLMMGWHPFFGKYSGAGEPPEVQLRIVNGWFPHSRAASACPISPPPGLPRLADLTGGDVAQLFERAFAQPRLGVERPTPREWMDSLDKLRRRLTVCANDRGHRYPAGLPMCCWCRILGEGGIEFFAGASAVGIHFTLDFPHLRGLRDRVRKARVSPVPEFSGLPRGSGGRRVGRPLPLALRIAVPPRPQAPADPTTGVRPWPRPAPPSLPPAPPPRVGSPRPRFELGLGDQRTVPDPPSRDDELPKEVEGLRLLAIVCAILVVGLAVISLAAGGSRAGFGRFMLVIVAVVDLVLWLAFRVQAASFRRIARKEHEDRLLDWEKRAAQVAAWNEWLREQREAEYTTALRAWEVGEAQRLALNEATRVEWEDEVRRLREAHEAALRPWERAMADWNGARQKWQTEVSRVRAALTPEFDRRRAALGEAELKYQHARKTRASLVRAHATTAERLCAKAEESFQACEEQHSQYQRELKGLGTKAESLARREYLKRQFLVDASIPGIGPGLIQLLAAAGIETAHDVELDRILAVPKFGMKRAEALLAWKQTGLDNFQFDPAKGVPEADLRDLARRRLQFAGPLVRLLEGYVEEAEKNTARLHNELPQADAELMRLAEAVAQAQADLEVVTDVLAGKTA